MVTRVRCLFGAEVDLEGERVRDAFLELWRLLARRPVRSRPWRDFWKVVLPSFTPLIVLIGLWDPADWSLVAWLAITVAAYLVAAFTAWLFRRLGLVGTQPGAREPQD